MGKIDAFQEDGIGWTYHVPKKAFRGVENLHHACMMKKMQSKKEYPVGLVGTRWCVMGMSIL